MQKIFLLIGSILGALTVVIGAFGAHCLEKLLNQNGRMANFETAVKYQMFHVAALLIIAMLMDKYHSAWMNYAAISMIVGIVLFSGSLYTLSMTNVTTWGAVTPIGGLAFILGWVFLAISIYKG